MLTEDAAARRGLFH